MIIVQKFINELSKLSMMILIIAGALFVLLGILLFKYPEQFIKTLISMSSVALIVLGAIMVVYGISMAIMFIASKMRKRSWNS